MDTVQATKQRFEIIGNDPKLNRHRESDSGCSTDISVLVVGELGKESIRKLYTHFLIENTVNIL
jgi:hypothetical protein